MNSTQRTTIRDRRSRSKKTTIRSRSRSQRTTSRSRSRDRSRDRTMSRRETTHTVQILNQLCGSIGIDLCLSLTQYRMDILKLFDGFKYFNNMKDFLEPVGNISVNGFVRRLTYEVENIKTYAILKSALNKMSDNLIYEYLVGRQLNMLRNIFPCFVETYSIYSYKKNEHWKECKKTSAIISSEELNSYLVLRESDYTEMIFEEPEKAAILIENIPSAIPLSQFMTIRERITADDFTAIVDFAEIELIYCLYQIYYVLDILKYDFTHYDLHDENIMIVKLPEGKYITYHFKTSDDKEVVFNSIYCVKIIDYGRSFFSKISMEVYDIVDKYAKEFIERNPTRNRSSVLKSIGFHSMSEESYVNFRIKSQARNMSHDLRLLHENIVPKLKVLSERNPSSERLTLLKRVLSKINYGRGMFNWLGLGTDEIIAEEYTGTISNVGQAEKALRSLIPTQPSYSSFTKMGDLYIDGKNEMRLYMS